LKTLNKINYKTYFYLIIFDCEFQHEFNNVINMLFIYLRTLIIYYVRIFNIYIIMYIKMYTFHKQNNTLDHSWLIRKGVSHVII